MTDIDWDELRQVATEAMERAYAPYSRYKVGAAALVSDGRIVSGCNVENASYGVGLCAECALVGDLHMSGGGELVAFVCVNGEGETIMPCGRCRQLLNEFALPGMLLEGPVREVQAGHAHAAPDHRADDLLVRGGRSEGADDLGLLPWKRHWSSPPHRGRKAGINLAAARKPF